MPCKLVFQFGDPQSLGPHKINQPLRRLTEFARIGRCCFGRIQHGPEYLPPQRNGDSTGLQSRNNSQQSAASKSSCPQEPGSRSQLPDQSGERDRDRSRLEPSGGGHWKAPPLSVPRLPAELTQAQHPELRLAGNGQLLIFISRCGRRRLLPPIEGLVGIHSGAPRNLSNRNIRHLHLCADDLVLIFRPIPSAY